MIINKTMRELVERINQLARKKRDGVLTSTEKKEQEKLRRLYLDSIRTGVSKALEASGFHPIDQNTGIITGITNNHKNSCKCCAKNDNNDSKRLH